MNHLKILNYISSLWNFVKLKNGFDYALREDAISYPFLVRGTLLESRFLAKVDIFS